MNDVRPAYVPGLDALRAIAALAVVLHHIEQMKKDFGFGNLWYLPQVRVIGGMAVTFFFVLSGYLITYLLLRERSRTGKVAVAPFYLRRVLRIWPLYFLIVFAAFFVFPGMVPGAAGIEGAFRANFWTTLSLFVAFLPNLANILFPIVYYAGHLWSIGTEEQFYVIWPWVIRWAKRPLAGPVAIVGMYFLVKVMVHGIPGSAWHWLHANREIVEGFLYRCRLDCMAIGGILAALPESSVGRRLLDFRLIQRASYIALAYFVMTGIKLKFHGMDFTQSVYSCLFVVVICHVSTIGTTNLLESPLPRYLGRISFGIYMFHPVVIGAVLTAAKALDVQLTIAGQMIVYLSAVGATVAVAALSFEYFESRVLRLNANPEKSGAPTPS